MINNSYNSLSLVTNKYNPPSSSSSNINTNFLTTRIIDMPEYRINLTDIYYYPNNLTYIVNAQTNIYLPEIKSNPYYSYITFNIINNLSDSISIFSSSNDCLIYSTFFNSVSGDTSMSIEGHRIATLTSTMINNIYSWTILIN